MPESILRRGLALLARRRAFWDSVPTRAFLLVLAAGFLTFATFGFMGDIIALGVTPMPDLMVNAILSGTTAIVWGLVIGRGARFIVVAAALHAVSLLKFVMSSPPAPLVFNAAGVAALQVRLQFDTAAVLVCVVAGYLLFIAFTRGQGRRYMRDRIEIELAREIHAQLVQPIDRRIGLFEFHGTSLPSGDVGGDLVDLVDTGAGWVACLADVSGHGVGAGALMGMFKSAVRSRVSAHATLEATLSEVHAVLIALRKPGMFVTAGFLASGDGDMVRFALAGHPPILHYHADQKTVTQLGLPQMPIAMLDEQSFTSSSVRLAPGDVLAIVSDGLMEVFDRDNRDFGLAGLEVLLAQYGRSPLADVNREVFAAVRRHGPQIDDQSLLLLRRASRA
jgi:serine phosphatase RsbU (regulator of sigma subunit)